ncbi:MAG: protein kinase [Planctomycetota bacterium]
MSSPPFERLGPFVLQREIGRGGMGVVYLGHDTRLDRAVAIKAMPEHLATDPDRLARFEREARTLAQLTHPNVAGIYGVEEHDGLRYLVLEYVEGETLAERLDRGPLPLDEAMDFAMQIASGIEAAHDAGVVHRDLKPGNVIVTPEGQAKVLDFGLARSEETTSSGMASESPTITSPAVHSPTVQGVILGTAAYMSPEQARGRRVDKRTDIWSYGVMLYEMLVGASPFVGETVSDSIGAVLHKEIDLERLPAATPPGVRRVLSRCVERDKTLRYRDIGDVRVDLLRARDEPEVAAPGPSGWGPGRRAVVGVLLAACIAGGWFGARALQTAPPKDVGRFDVVVDDDHITLTDTEPQFSPDGTRLAFMQDGALHVRDMASFESRILPGTEGVIAHCWSPDGAWIAFHTRSSISKVALSGGSPIKLCTPVSLDSVAGMGWTADEHLVYSDGRDGIMQVSTRGGTPSQRIPLDKGLVDYHDVNVPRGSNTILYVRHYTNMRFVVVAHDGEKEVTIAEMEDAYLSHPTYASTGHVLFSRGPRERSLWAVPFDLDGMQVLGDPFLVEPGAWQSTVSGDGSLIVQRGNAAYGGTFALATPEGKIDAIPADFEVSFGPTMSPDGSRLAFSAGVETKVDVWVHEFERGINSRITFEEQFNVPVSWSPDGREIAYVQFTPESETNMQTRFAYADGSGISRPPLDGLFVSFDANWTMAVGFDGMPGGDSNDAFLVALDNPETQTPISPISTATWFPSLSPDGELLAYSSAESGQSEVYCTQMPDGRGRWQVSVASGSNPRWSTDGTRLYYSVDGDEAGIYEAVVTREPTVRFERPVRVIDAKAMPLLLQNGGWNVEPDGERFIVKMAPDDENKERTSISIIQNWFEQFRDR